MSRSSALKIVCCAALAVLLAVVILFVSSTPREESHFRGVQWGAAAGSQQGLEQVAQDGTLTFYSRKGEELQVENIPVERIVYGFYKDRFYSALVYFRTEESMARFKEAMRRRYGDPVQTEPGQERFFWNTNSLSVLLNYDPATQSGRFSCFFKPIQIEAELNP